ncbi:cell wall integrity and stress response component [Microdochium nivale]|nr:cell wall integrity and stress response component [Microdochium nivale]
MMAAPRITGMAVLATRGESSAGPITLPPQQTPFIPPTVCDLSVYCPYMSDKLYSSKAALASHPLSGQQCHAFYTTSGNPTDRIRHVEACMPQGYRQLYGGDGAFDLNSPPIGTDMDAMLTSAYPGSACMLGWTSACVNSIERQTAGRATQFLCCPGGGWRCLATISNSDNTGRKHRLCERIITEATELWMSFDPPETNAYLDHQLYTWHRPVSAEGQSQFAATAYHYALPLQDDAIHGDLYSPVSTASDAIAETSSGTLDGMSSSLSSNHPSAPLTSGEVAGIVIGATAVVFLVLLAGLFACHRHHHHRQQHKHCRGRKALSIAILPDTPGGTANLDLSTGSSFGGFPKAELDAATPTIVPSQSLHTISEGTDRRSYGHMNSEEWPGARGNAGPASIPLDVNRSTYAPTQVSPVVIEDQVHELAS